MIGVAIIGAGQAGLQAAVSLRQGGYSGSIALFGDEPQAPYQRPPLSKKFLSGEIGAERLELRPQQFFTENNITLHLGTSVASLDVSASEITTNDGKTHAFEHAILATGTRPRALNIPGADLEGVLTLRSIADVDRLRPSIAEGKKAVIVGGGYIGLEVAAVAKSLGLDVTVIETFDRVLQRVVSPDMSDFFAKTHALRGVKINAGEAVTRISLNHGSRVVETNLNTEYPADIILIAVGAVPNTELAEAAGLEVKNGIVVDENAKTSAENIFAAGDCTSFYSRLYGRHLRLESVQNAIDQAKIAALSILGTAETYDPVPWFWSDQYDIKLQIAGLSDGYDQADLRGDPDTNAFGIVYGKDGTLIAVDTVNQPRGHMLARRAIGKPLADFDWHP